MSSYNNFRDANKKAEFQQKLAKAIQIAEMEERINREKKQEQAALELQLYRNNPNIYYDLIVKPMQEMKLKFERRKSKKVRFVETRFYCYIPIESAQRQKKKECKHNTEDCTHYWRRELKYIAPDWRDSCSLKQCQLIEEYLISCTEMINTRNGKNKKNTNLWNKASVFAKRCAKLSQKYSRKDQREIFEKLIELEQI